MNHDLGPSKALSRTHRRVRERLLADDLKLTDAQLADRLRLISQLLVEGGMTSPAPYLELAARRLGTLQILQDAEARTEALRAAGDALADEAESAVHQSENWSRDIGYDDSMPVDLSDLRGAAERYREARS